MQSAIYWPSFFFLLFAAIACLFAVAVVLAQNIVRMAFYLVLSLAATAGLFFLAGADFVGAMQIMIYVGGTLVLLVFGVMLTSHAPFVSMRTRSGEWILAIVVGGSLLALLLWTAFFVRDWRAMPLEQARQVEVRATASRIGLSLLGTPAEKFARLQQEAAHPAAPRTSQGVTGYLLLFEIISVHLLVVLVGAAYLARPRRRLGEAAQ